MKNLITYLILGLALVLSSCSDNTKEDIVIDTIRCNDGCLFVMEDISASIIYMDCFQKYAIQTQYPDNKSITIYGIPSSLEEEYNVDGKEIIFTATFRENSLVPLFPDPSFNMESIYEIELLSIK